MTFTTLSPLEASFVFNLICLYPAYRVFTRAGLKTIYSILILTPFIGLVVIIGILAHSKWPTVPPLKKKDNV